jgi:AraC family transcriptional regulator
MVTMFMGREYTAEINGGVLSEVTVRPLAHLIGRDALIGQVAKKFRRMCREEASANAYYVESIGTMLGTHLLQALVQRADQFERDGRLADEALLRVTHHIEEHLGERLSLATLGGVAGFSSSHFGRLFKASMGMAPHEYVMRRRVAKAEVMLHDTDRKEVEIASLCGFSDETLMARWFRRILECRPSEIRAQRPR